MNRLGFPPVGEHRRFVSAIVADTIGSGLFMPMTIIYFLRVTDLTIVEVGAALSLSALITLPSAFVIGSLVDRFGARRMMLIGNVMQAVGMAAYLWIESFWAVALWTVLLNIGRQAFWGSFGNVVTAITEPGERELWFGFLQALRNLGYAAGGILAGIALQLDTEAAFHAVVIANAATFLIAFWLLLDVPDHRSAVSDDAPVEGWGTVLRDTAYLRLVLAQLAYVVGVMVLNFALPVYAAEVIDLPGWVVGAIFTLNTIMVGLGQGLAVRWMTGRVRAHMMALANVLFVGGYALFVVAGLVPVWLGVIAMLLGAAVYTSGELAGTPVYSATAAEAAPDHLRGRYLGLVQLIWGVGGTLTPIVFTLLLELGANSIWWALTAVAAAGVVSTLRLPRTLPTAGERVTTEATSRRPEATAEEDPQGPSS